MEKPIDNDSFLLMRPAQRAALYRRVAATYPVNHRERNKMIILAEKNEAIAETEAQRARKKTASKEESKKRFFDSLYE